MSPPASLGHVDASQSPGPPPNSPHYREKAPVCTWAGYVVAILFSLILGLLASFELQSVVSRHHDVQDVLQSQVVEVERMRASTLERSMHGRGYLISGRAELLEESDAGRRSFDERLHALALRARTPHEHDLLERISSTHKSQQASLARAFALKRAGGDPNDIASFFNEEILPKQITHDEALAAYALWLDSRLEVARDDARLATERAMLVLLGSTGIAVVIAALLGLVLLKANDARRRASFETLAAHAQAQAAQLELSQSVARLERVNADLDAFAGRIAHDLRNLLTPIALVPARLRRARDDGAIDRIAASLERSVTRANAVLEGLLAFSRSGRPAEQMRPASVRDVVAQVTEDLAPLTAASQAALDIDVDDAHVACSPELLHVVVLNLLGNALKYLGPSVERRVTIRSRGEAGGVWIVVEDSGPGIPEGSVARIFEPFFRVPGASAPGTGIGLATVLRIVTAHGGRIECASVVGKGTRFRVWLPAPPPARLAGEEV